jgi:hypothetical protein
MPALWGVPVPSSDQIIVGAELLIILYPIRSMMRSLDNQARKERNRIIAAHVKSGHNSRFWKCLEGSCPSLQNSQPARTSELVPEIEVEVD